MPRVDDLHFLTAGVGELNVYATVGSPTTPPDARERRHVPLRHLKPVLPCTPGCKGGGFELAFHLWETMFERQRTDATGQVRCRGYRDLAGGRRQACDHTMIFRAIVKYDPRTL